MPKRPPPDLDERFTLHPLEGEEVLRKLLRAGDEAEDEPGEEEDEDEPDNRP